MVSCLVVETDLGFCALATRGRGLWRSCLPEASPEAALAALNVDCKKTVTLGTCDASPSSLNVLEAIGRQLVSFMRGDPVELNVELDLQDARPFTQAVLRECSLIPRGATLTYGELALKAGYPGAARAVGQAMARNLLPPFVPCHRVVGADGALTGFGGGIALKAKLLQMEGVALVQKGSVVVLANLASGLTSGDRRMEQGRRRG
jgi:methylated-DNA-[protein]-cysteine S-methyltransferase